MRIKKVKARTVSEALLKARAEAGDGALILETRKNGDFAELLVAVSREDKRGETIPSRIPGRQKRMPRALTLFKEKLALRGLSEGIIETILYTLEGCDLYLEEPGDPAVPVVASRTLASLIRCKKIPSSENRIVAFVGPTGVGKTTTLAKLASIAALDESRDVAIITLDTYRMGAVEQLRAFADLLSVPMSVVFTPLDLKEALRKYKYYERIFIDTPGRGPLDMRRIREIRAFLQEDGVDTVLVLPAGARLEDLRRAGRAFGVTKPKGLVITKWDETTIHGEAISYAVESGIPLSWIADGQEVPDDIHPAVPEKVATAVIQGSDVAQRRKV